MKNKHSNLKWVFFGTPNRAVIVLDILKKQGLIPSLVVTRPDAPKGRGQQLQMSDVKKWALENSVPVLEPEKIDESFRKKINYEEWNLFVVAAYGKILPSWLLDIPRHGALNIHFSLLPLYRGATPVETQILEGIEETGVTIMLLDEKMDHGPIVAQEAIPMPSPLPSNDELVKTLSEAGANLLAETIPEWVSGGIEPQEQEHEHATYTRKFQKSEAEIDLSDSPIKNFKKIQAFSTWPRAYFFANKNDKKTRIIITEAHMEEGNLVLDKVIPEGKKETDWKDFKRNL